MLVLNTDDAHQRSSELSLNSSSSSVASSTRLPLFPDVRLKKLPFYDILDVLLKPSNLGKLDQPNWLLILSPANCFTHYDIVSSSINGL